MGRVTTSRTVGCTEVLNKLESIFEQELGPNWELVSCTGDYYLLPTDTRAVLAAELEAAGKIVSPFNYTDLWEPVTRLKPKKTQEEFERHRARIKELEKDESESDLY